MGPSPLIFLARRGGQGVWLRMQQEVPRGHGDGGAWRSSGAEKEIPPPARAPGPPLFHTPSPWVPATDFLQIFAQLWKQCVAGSSLPHAWHRLACSPGQAAAPHPAPQGSGVPAARPCWQYGARGGARAPLSAGSLWFPTPGGPSYLFSSLYEIHQPPRAALQLRAGSWRPPGCILLSRAWPWPPRPRGPLTGAGG